MKIKIERKEESRNTKKPTEKQKKVQHGKGKQRSGGIKIGIKNIRIRRTKRHKDRKARKEERSQ